MLIKTGYVTKEVHEVIPLELQQFLWLIIDSRKAAGDRLFTSF
nr:DUF960 family protein [Bacillus cereus]